METPVAKFPHACHAKRTRCARFPMPATRVARPQEPACGAPHPTPATRHPLRSNILPREPPASDSPPCPRCHSFPRHAKPPPDTPSETLFAANDNGTALASVNGRERSRRLAGACHNAPRDPHLETRTLRYAFGTTHDLPLVVGLKPYLLIYAYSSRGDDPPMGHIRGM